MYTSENKQRKFLDQFGVGPTITKLYSDPEIVKENPEFPNHLLGLKGSFPMMNFPGQQEYQDFFDQQVQSAYSGTLTAEKAVVNVIQKWSELMKKNGKPEAPYTGDYK